MDGIVLKPEKTQAEIVFLFSHTCFLHLKHQLIWTLSSTFSRPPEQLCIAAGFQEWCLTHYFLSFLFGVLEHWSMDVTCLKDSLSSEKHAHNLKRYLAICHGVKFLREDKNKLMGKKRICWGVRHTQKQHLAQKVPELKTIGSWESTAGNNHIHLPCSYFSLSWYWRYSIRVGGDLIWQLKTDIISVSCTQRQVSYNRPILMLKCLIDFKFDFCQDPVTAPLSELIECACIFTLLGNKKLSVWEKKLHTELFTLLY